MSLTENISKIIPKIKNKIQLIGLIVVVVGYVTTKIVAPEMVIAQISAGSIGVLILVFAQLFEYIDKFPKKDRVHFVQTLFIVFACFTLLLLFITGYFIYISPKSDNKFSKTEKKYATVFDPSSIGYKSSTITVKNSEANDEEFLSIWKNVQSLEKTHNEVKQINDITWLAVGKCKNAFTEDWKIICKRHALEDIAKYLYDKFPDKNHAKDMFIKGKLIDLKYFDNTMEVKLLFKTS